MSTVQAHYDQLLGAVYTWMAGGFEAAVTRNRQLLAALGLASWPKGLAVDLGCGSGFTSIPLAETGYHVIGIDQCEPLLAELRDRAVHLPVRTVNDDLTHFASHLNIAPQLIVCTGDTLTHLPSLESVIQLLNSTARILAPGGRLVLGFRDLATLELKGSQRFIPVRSEPERIFTCFLDYHPDHVEVNDLLYLKSGETWKLTGSSYRKLRIDAIQVGKLVTNAGLILEHSSTDQGLVSIVARSHA